MFGLMRNFVKWVIASREKSYTLAILGVDNAGKTTLRTALTGGNQDLISPTIGFSSDTLKIGTKTIKLYDLGGGTNFRGIWKRYFSEAHGAIFVIDSTDNIKLPTVHQTLVEVSKEPRFVGKPILIFANKQDLVENFDLQQFSNSIGTPDIGRSQYLIKTCSSLRKDGQPVHKEILEGLSWLLSTIDAEYRTLNNRIKQEVAEQQEQEKREKEEKIKRVEAMRRERELEKQKKELQEQQKEASLKRLLMERGHSGSMRAISINEEIKDVAPDEHPFSPRGK